jgi:6-phosphogluconolactonase
MRRGEVDMSAIIREQDQKRLLQMAGRHLCEKIRGVLAVKNRAILAVPGGRSAAAIFKAMLSEELDWRRVHLFIVDERLVPVDHPDSNFKLLREHLVVPLVQAGRIDAGNAHPFIFDPASGDRGAAGYERVLAGFGFRYDLVLLSAGEDGHVGALYPRHHSIEDRHHGFIVMDDSPKPPPGRMTSSLSLMQTASAAVIVFAGEAKREAWGRFNDRTCPVSDCPAKLLLAIVDTAVFTDLHQPQGGRMSSWPQPVAMTEERSRKEP